MWKQIQPIAVITLIVCIYSAGSLQCIWCASKVMQDVLSKANHSRSIVYSDDCLSDNKLGAMPTQFCDSPCVVFVAQMAVDSSTSMQFGMRGCWKDIMGNHAAVFEPQGDLCMPISFNLTVRDASVPVQADVCSCGKDKCNQNSDSRRCKLSDFMRRRKRDIADQQQTNRFRRQMQHDITEFVTSERNVSKTSVQCYSCASKALQPETESDRNAPFYNAVKQFSDDCNSASSLAKMPVKECVGSCMSFVFHTKGDRRLQAVYRDCGPNVLSEYTNFATADLKMQMCCVDSNIFGATRLDSSLTSGSNETTTSTSESAMSSTQFFGSFCSAALCNNKDDFVECQKEQTQLQLPADFTSATTENSNQAAAAANSTNSEMHDSNSTQHGLHQSACLSGQLSLPLLALLLMIIVSQSVVLQ